MEPGMVLNMEENVRIAREMCELGLWKEVLAFAQQWHMDEPSDSMALYYIGLGFTGLREFRKAEAAYRRALAIAPSAVHVWNNLAGLLYEFMNCQSEGIRCMERALELNPDHKLGCSNLATMVGRLGQHEEAITHADRAIALDPELVEAHLHKGRAALALGKMESSKKSVRGSRPSSRKNSAARTNDQPQNGTPLLSLRQRVAGYAARRLGAHRGD